MAVITVLISGRIHIEYGHFFMPFSGVFFWYKRGNIIQELSGDMSSLG